MIDIASTVSIRYVDVNSLSRSLTELNIDTSASALTPFAFDVTTDFWESSNILSSSSSKHDETLDVSRETIVNTSNYITTDKSLGKAYISKNIHLENMEYYAVLKVAKSFDIPAAGVFIVTNYCDKNAHKDFMDNHKEAMLRLTKYIKESK